MSCKKVRNGCQSPQLNPSSATQSVILVTLQKRPNMICRHELRHMTCFVSDLAIMSTPLSLATIFLSYEPSPINSDSGKPERAFVAEYFARSNPPDLGCSLPVVFSSSPLIFVSAPCVWQLEGSRKLKENYRPSWRGESRKTFERASRLLCCHTAERRRSFSILCSCEVGGA